MKQKESNNLELNRAPKVISKKLKENPGHVEGLPCNFFLLSFNFLQSKNTANTFLFGLRMAEGMAAFHGGALFLQIVNGMAGFHVGAALVGNGMACFHGGGVLWATCRFPW